MATSPAVQALRQFADEVRAERVLVAKEFGGTLAQASELIARHGLPNLQDAMDREAQLRVIRRTPVAA